MLTALMMILVAFLVTLGIVVIAGLAFVMAVLFWVAWRDAPPETLDA